jgi:hypothetical protein
MTRTRGYSFISLDDALLDDAYRSPDSYTGEESINWLARWALTKGLKGIDEVRDEIPDVPDFVVDAGASAQSPAPVPQSSAASPEQRNKPAAATTAVSLN